jgi:hypothetical protein
MVKQSRNERGSLMIELVIALGILTAAIIPLGYSFAQEKRFCRVYYWRAVAMEIVDGEMEILAAGDWRSFQEGPYPYTVKCDAAKNLPPGQFVLSIRGKQLRLQWQPTNPRDCGPVIREALGR